MMLFSKKAHADSLDKMTAVFGKCSVLTNMPNRTTMLQGKCPSVDLVLCDFLFD